MKKTTKSKLVEGALIGAALGIVAGLALAPKAGEELRADVLKRVNEFYAYLAPRLKKLKKMGEKDFQDFVVKAARAYAKARKLSAEESESIIAEAKKSWKHIKKFSL